MNELTAKNTKNPQSTPGNLNGLCENTAPSAVKSLWRLIFIFLLFLSSYPLAAQLYPVRTITNVGAPYPLSLEQYGSFDNSRLQLTIIPNDIALQNYPINLRLYISGGWFKIYTNPAFIHKDILLNNGETMTFTGADLAEWFNPNNLIFEGYSKAQYLKTGRLPEGVYQIWFEAWDMYRDFNISGSTKAMVFTLENEPPILNFPENKKELDPYDPQNIVFNWSFRQSPFSASGSSHQYRFELWEIDPDNMNAEEAVRVMRPIYTTEVNATTLNYTAAEPLLFKGKRYAWRIQVFDPMGTMRYKNDGYSQVYWFRFGKDIPVPVLTLDKTTTSSITVKWENDYRIPKYELRYRNNAKEGANWYTKDAPGQSATIDNLQQNTPYEIQLHGISGTQEGDYSESVIAKTNQDKAFACGTGAGTSASDNSEPLSALKAGDVFRASDFDIEVYRASGANGTFTGRGFALVPMLKFLRFEVEFNGVQINREYRMTNGEVRFIYNEGNGLVANISKIIGALQSGEPRIVEDNPYTQTADKKIISNAEITEITVDANGVVTAKTSDGRTTQVRGSASGDMVAVSGGNDEAEQYVADSKTGTVYKGTPEKANSGKTPVQPTTKPGAPAQYVVTFLPHTLQLGGMDIPTGTSPAANYNQIQIGDKTIQVPWKSVESNKIDRLLAHISNDPADSVRFLTEKGNLVMTAPGDKAFVNKSAQNIPGSGSFKQLLVTGTEDEDNLKAWYPEYEQVKDSTKKQNRILAGQVNVVAYDKIMLEVCIVEVNGATVPETLPIEKELNEIYASSLVQWKVSRIRDFKVNIEGMQNGIFDNTDPNNDMDYTDHEKQVKEAIKDYKDYNRKTLYLFFIGGKTKDKDLKGYMPFNKQFGFIFRENQQIQELIRTIAHELGHGAFRLRHPFSPKCPYPQTKGQTNNLMDYVDAGKALQSLALHKYQWDEVHDFDLGLNWFEDAGEGEMLAGCKPPKPSEPTGDDRAEGKFATTSCQTSSISHGEQLTATRTQVWYYHIEDKPYTACCDDNGKYVTVQPEYKTGWYTEEQYCEEVIKSILVSFGILNGNVTVLSTNLESRKISAGYNLEQFFKDRPVSDDILKTLETSYYPQICKDATNMLSGSGRIDPVNIEFDLVLTLTGVGEARAMLRYLRAKSFAKGAKLFASRTSKGIEILSKEGGEKIALYADNALKEIRYIDEGGEILGSTGKIKVIEKDGSTVESVLQIVGKDGRIGFRKIISKLGNIWDDIVIKGKKGITETLSSKYKNIDEYLAGTEYAQKVASDFAKYKSKGGALDLVGYTAKHKIITQNRMQGKIAEDVFKSFEAGIKPRKAIQTSDGARYVDNVLDGTAREIKSGKITLTGNDFQRQIKKDIEIIKQQRSLDVQKIEWHALDGIDNNALEFIRNEMTRQGVSPDLFKIVIY